MAVYTYDDIVKFMNLNLSEEITIDIIKKAYKKSSLQIHPDKNPGNAEPFQNLNSANTALTKIWSKGVLDESVRNEMAEALIKSSASIRGGLLKQINKVNLDEGFRIKEEINFQLRQASGNYAYATVDSGRSHGKYSVQASIEIKSALQDLKGDALKTAILVDFKASLKEINDPEDLKARVKEFKESPEFKILATGQGFMTKTFGLKTSSVESFEAIVEDKENEIDYRAKNQSNNI